MEVMGGRPDKPSDEITNAEALVLYVALGTLAVASVTLALLIGS